MIYILNMLIDKIKFDFYLSPFSLYYKFKYIIILVNNK